MAELGDLLGATSKQKKDVHVDMLDYSYVDKCTDADELRAILKVLKSGKEGRYPHLETHTEERLLSVLPDRERARLIAMRTEPTVSEASAEADALADWADQMSAESKTASRERAFQTRERALPPVRGRGQPTKVRRSAKASKQTEGTEETKQASQQESERLSGYDFRAWEKFDVDAAIAAVDEEDEAAEAKRQERRAEAKREQEARARRRAQELERVRQQFDPDALTPTERLVAAQREKNKGNECFRAGEMDEAEAFYTRSLALDPSSAVVFANRASVHLRRENFAAAEDDCSAAVELDPAYTKAWKRRGTVRHRRGKYQLAINDFQRALELAPGSADVSALLAKAEAKHREVSGTAAASTSAPKREFKRVAIVDSDSDSDSDSGSDSDGDDAFVRVQIASYDSDEEGGDTQDKPGTPGSFTRIAIEAESSESESESADPAYTRIAISGSGSDSDSDSDGDAAAAAPSFTRVPIAEDDDDEEDEETDEQKAEALKEEGNRLVGQGQLREAIGKYNDALDLAPAASELAEKLHTNSAAAHWRLEDMDGVISAATLALGVNARSVKALVRRGAAHEKLGHWDAALADFRAALAAQPGLRPAVDAIARCEEAQARAQARAAPPQTEEADDPQQRSDAAKLRGNQALKAGDVAAAVREYSTALEELPGNTAARCNRALAFLKLNQPSMAASDAELVLEAEPRNVKALFRLGRAKLGLGEAAAAVAVLERALAVEPNNEPARKELAKARAAVPPPAPAPVREAPAPVREAAPVEAVEQQPGPVNEEVAEQVRATQQAEAEKRQRTARATEAAKKRVAERARSSNKAPKTYMQFERAWRSLRADPAGFNEYLKLVKPSQLPKLFKSSLDPGVLSSIFEALDSFTAEEDPERALAFLSKLSKTSRFSMTVMLMSPSDRERVRVLFNKVEDALGAEQVDPVRPAYGM